MKQLLSVVVAVVLLSSNSLLAADAAPTHAEEAKVQPSTAKPVVEQEPAHLRLAKFVNACLLQQGVNPQAEQIARSIGADIR